MLVAWVVILLAENANGICDIGPSSGHLVHQASDHRLVYGRIAGFFVGFPLMTLHCHWRGNWPGLVHSELCQDRLNVAVLMDVDRVMFPIVFNVHADREGDTTDIMHPEPLLHLVIDVPNQALVGNDEEIIAVQNDCGDDYALILKHEQSSVDT
jgi:hypothetical protein